MPGLSGLQLAGIMQQKPIVIFLTAYHDYAIEAFNVSAIDYLLKPVSFERFMQGALKALDYHKLRLAQNNNTEEKASSGNTATEQVSLASPENTGVKHNFIYVYVEYSLVKIDTSTILYIEGLKDYVKIFLSTSTRPIITRISMKLLEEKLLPFDFLRIHRSYIVSINNIASVQKSLITIADKILPVGESYRDALTEAISKRNILNIS